MEQMTFELVAILLAIVGLPIILAAHIYHTPSMVVVSPINRAYAMAQNVIEPGYDKMQVVVRSAPILGFTKKKLPVSDTNGLIVGIINAALYMLSHILSVVIHIGRSAYHRAGGDEFKAVLWLLISGCITIVRYVVTEVVLATKAMSEAQKALVCIVMIAVSLTVIPVTVEGGVVATIPTIECEVGTQPETKENVLRRHEKKKIEREFRNLSNEVVRNNDGSADIRTSDGKRMVELITMLKDSTIQEWVPERELPFLRWITQSSFDDLDYKVINIKTDVLSVLKGMLTVPDGEYGVLPCLIIPGKEGSRVVYLKGYNKGMLEFLTMECGLEVKGDQVIKTAKRLKRLFLRPTPYSRVFGDGAVDVAHTSVERMSWIDGCEVTIKRAFASEKMHLPLYIQRVSLTLLDKIGLLKGHAMIVEDTEQTADVLIWHSLTESPYKKEVVWAKSNKTFIGLDPVKRSDYVRLDIQTLSTLYPTLKSHLSTMCTLGLADLMSKWQNGELAEGLIDINPLEDIKVDYALQSFLQRGGDYLNIPHFGRQVWNMFTKKRDKMSLGRIPIMGAIRVYAIVHPELSSGNVMVEGANLWISRDDCEETLLRHGGADQDDSFVLIPLPGGRVLMYRNPNQLGEYSIMNLSTDSDWTPTHEWDLDISLLTQKAVLPQCDTVVEFVKVDKNSILLNSFLKVKQYTNRAVLQAQLNLDKLSGAIGKASNATMISALVGIDANIELEVIIDAEAKDGWSVQVEEEMKKIHIFYTKLIEECTQVPLAFEFRVPRKYRESINFVETDFDTSLQAVTDKCKEADAVMAELVNDSYENIPESIVTSQPKDGALNIARNIRNEWRILYGEAIEWEIEARKSCLSRVDHEELDILMKGKREQIGHMIAMHLVKSRMPLAATHALWTLVYMAEENLSDAILWIGDSGDLKGTAHYSMRILQKAGKLQGLSQGAAGAFMNLKADKGTIDEHTEKYVKTIVVTGGLKSAINGLSSDDADNLVSDWHQRVSDSVERLTTEIIEEDGRMWLCDEVGRIGVVMNAKEVNVSSYNNVNTWRVLSSKYSCQLISG